MSAAPLPFRWSGDAMEILPRFAKMADAAFVVGQVYRLEAIEERSAASHRHYFATLNDAWLGLPESYGEQFQSSEALRKFALIKTGYFDSRTLVASSRAEAQRIAAFVKPIGEEFSVVVVKEATVTIYTAKSQSMRSMGKKDFGESKQKVLEFVADLLSVSVDKLTANSKEAA